MYNRTDWHSFQGLNRCANCLTAHPRATPIVISRGFHRGFQKGFHFQNESCDCIKYLNLGEFLITVMSSLSQEESRSISENVRWGMRKKMQDGKYSVVYSHFLGYDRGPDGGMVINHNEAKVVKYIYRSCLQGYSDTAIAKRLMELGVPAPYGGERWHPAVVWNMLSNEKMKGDALIQKSYVQVNSAIRLAVLTQSRRSRSPLLFFYGYFFSAVSIPAARR